ncbi:MAG TPA: hypothetical protein VNW28_03930 [Chthoniobacterales bacterium]|nr:hypothetical protein [Chthoniobacterales bacterium]
MGLSCRQRPPQNSLTKNKMIECVRSWDVVAQRHGSGFVRARETARDMIAAGEGKNVPRSGPHGGDL